MKFFVSCPLGVERALAKEIEEFWGDLVEPNPVECLPFEGAVPFEGGVELESSLAQGLQINIFSKLAHRVLLRMSEFRARNWGELQKGLERISWDPYLKKDHLLLSRLQFEVSSHASHLYHKRKIEEFLVDFFKKKFFKKSNLLQNSQLKEGSLNSGESPQKIYLRFHQDRCQVSLDTSGEHLHRRGVATQKGAAPMRENLASMILKKIMEDVTLGELGRVRLIDPMCGSGTFLFEAHQIFQPNLRRAYAFQNFPSCPKILFSASLKSHYREIALSPFGAYLGYDLDPQMVEMAQSNAQHIRGAFAFRVGDLFRLPLIEGDLQNWVICNPPYGERLQADFAAEDLITAINRAFAPQRVAVVLSQDQSAKVRKSLTSNWRSFDFQSGGLHLKLWLMIQPASHSTP